MDKVIKGIRSFQENDFPQKKDLFATLAGGQSPRLLIITCSDSRIDPSLITHTEPGEIFVIRNAGNIVPPFTGNGCGEEATIEYAVAALKVKHIVVCGHSGCGAMGGLLAPESLAAVPSVANWLQLARPTRAIVDAAHASLNGAERLAKTVEVNALQQLVNLRGHPSVAAALATDAVTLHSWVYDIPSGSVNAYNENSKSFVSVEKSPEGIHAHLMVK